MTTFLVDNSVWQKAGRSGRIARRLREVSVRDLIITCPAQVLEYCWAVQDARAYADLRADMDAFLPADTHPGESLVLDIQQNLWSSGLVRAAGVVDCLIAAYAIVNQARVLHSDHDFRHIHVATGGRLRHEYVPE